MLTCKFCGNENNDGASVCYICGKSLTAGRVDGLVGLGGESQQYHAVNDSLPYGADVQTATRFQSDTGGGAHSGPTQQTFGAQMMAGQTTEKKSSGSAGTTVIGIILLLLVAGLVWYLFFSPYAIM